MAKKDDNENERPQDGREEHRQPEAVSRESVTASQGGIPANIVAALQALAAAGGVPVNLNSTPQPRIDTAARLNAKPRLTVLFPSCADELLSLIHTGSQDEVTRFFNDYFKFQRHRILGQYLTGTPPQPAELEPKLPEVLDGNLLGCAAGTPEGPLATYHFEEGVWPSDCCVCRPCVTLDGKRNPTAPAPPQLPNPAVPSLKRLFVGDAVFLFWLGERLGVFQIVGAILDAYASTGSLPISNGSLDPGIRDDVTALVLEIMVRQMKQGLASASRERASLFRTSLGWNTPAGQKLQVQSQVNTGFNTQFHRFIYHALEFYRDRRMAVAIRGSAAPAPPPSVATLITIGDTIDVLKKRFEAWDYGRNMYHTLSGLVWMIAGMSVIRELRSTLGIPPAYDEPHEYIPAAYDLLVAKKPVTQGSENRYILHRELAANGRDLLLDLEVIDHTQRDPGGELDNWLSQVEAKVEGYRTAYRTLTNVDLGSSGSPAIEQQA